MSSIFCIKMKKILLSVLRGRPVLITHKMVKGSACFFTRDRAAGGKVFQQNTAGNLQARLVNMHLPGLFERGKILK